jgi:multidrug resistance efflux pump
MTGVQRKTWSLLLLLLSLIGLSFACAALATVEVTAEAAGVLRAPNGLRPVASVLAGSITEVLVRGGDAVEAGQVVARLEATELRATLESRARELDIVRDDVTRADRHDREIETQTASAMRRRRAALEQRIAINSERLKQRRSQHEDLDTLVQRGGASRAEGLSAKESMQEASESVSSLGLELALLDLEISDRARQWQERESSRRTQLSRAEANVEEAQTLLAASEIRAPASGRVESLLASPGSVVPAGAVLASCRAGRSRSSRRAPRRPSRCSRCRSASSAWARRASAACRRTWRRPPRCRRPSAKRWLDRSCASSSSCARRTPARAWTLTCAPASA